MRQTVSFLLLQQEQATYLVKGTLQCKCANRQPVSGVADGLLIATELQQALKTPQLLPYLQCIEASVCLL